MSNPPSAKKIPHSVTHHGITLTDDYAWLRQDNWANMFRDTSLLNADIRAHLEAENKYTTDNLVNRNQPMIDVIVDEMISCVEIAYDTAGIVDGEWRYFRRFSELDYPIYLRRHNNGTEQVLLNPNTEFKEFGAKVFMGAVEHSPNHRYLALCVDFSGSEDTTLWIKDLETGKFLDEKLAHADTPVWSLDSTKIYYTKLPDGGAQLVRDRVFCHTLGAQQSDDALILQKPSPHFHLHIHKTDSARFLVITLKAPDAVEQHLLDLEYPEAPLIVPAPHTDLIRYATHHHGNDFYIVTNADSATEFKIMRTPISTPTRENWVEVEPYRLGRYIRRLYMTRDFMVRWESENALPHIVVTHMTSGDTHRIPFDAAAYDAEPDLAAGFDDNLLRIYFSAPNQPHMEIDYNMDTRARTVLRTEKIPHHKPDDYIVERRTAPSHDGVAVPVTIIYHRDTKIDGTAPAFLYAYGSYGHCLEANFYNFKKRYSLLKRGFVCVDAHIRGGADMGFGWYENGKMGKKKNTFLDFIACAKFLIDENYTAPGKIAIKGESAGGMLMGAVMNMAPENMFGCVIASVPFVDVMHTMLDASLPLTPPEWTEWGNPITDKSAFDYMLSYSPYDNVVAKNYPALFTTCGLTDPRVTYWEPAKWVAKLRATKTDTKPLYFYTALDSGHFGNPGRFSRFPELAREIVFMIDQVGK